jgi:uncharacterized phage protein (TIGR02218 family)
MSKTVTAGMATHLASELSTLALCWKATATNGTILAFTTHDQDITYLATTYVSSLGGTPTSVSTTGALSVDNVDLDMLLDTLGFTAADLQAGIWDYATLDVFLLNYADLTIGEVKLRRGKVGQVSLKRGSFLAEVRGLLQYYTTQLLETYQPGCQADLGDARCTVDLTPFTVTGTITGTTVGNNRIFVDSARTEAVGWFDGGLLTWTSGLNNGLQMEVKSYTLVDTTIQLVLAMPHTVAVGDTYSVYAGCDKSLLGTNGCKVKFNNVVNFRGFPHIPQKQELSMPYQHNTFGG